MSDISKKVHPIFVAIILTGSFLIWLNQRGHRHVAEASSSALQKNVDEIRSQIATAEAETSSLRAAMERSSSNLQARIATLARERDAQKQKSRASEPVPPAELPYRWNDAATTVRLGKRVMTSLGIDPFEATEDGHFQLDHRVATVLSLSPTEAKGVQSAIDNLVAQQRTIEKERLQITPGNFSTAIQWMMAGNPDLVLSFSLPAFPDEGQQIETAFRSALDQSIGPSRSEMLMAMAAGELQNDFGNFGQLPRWITFRERLESDGMLTLGQTTGNWNGEKSTMSTTIDPNRLATTQVTPIPAGWRDLVGKYYYRGISIDLRNSGLLEPGRH